MKKIIIVLMSSVILLFYFNTCVFADSAKDIATNTIVGQKNNDSEIILEDGVNLEDIPHNNIIVTPTNQYLTGNGNVSESRISLQPYYNTNGELVNEQIYSIYGNILYCNCWTSDYQEFYYLKSIDGSIIYAGKHNLYVSEYIADKKVSSTCNLIRVGDDGSYDIIDVINCIYYDYNFDDHDSLLYDEYNTQFYGDTLLVAKEGKSGILGMDGKLITDLIFDAAYYTDDYEAIIVYQEETGYGAYDINGNMIVPCENLWAEYYSKAKLFVFSNDEIYKSPERLIGGKPTQSEPVKIINLNGDVVFQSDRLKGTNICYVKEIDESILVWEQILDNESDDYWKERNYIVDAQGNIIDLARKYGTQYSDIGFQYPINGLCGANDGAIIIKCYNATSYDYWEGYGNLNVTFYGYVDYNGNVLVDYTNEVKLNSDNTNIEKAPTLQPFHDGYAQVRNAGVITGDYYYIDKTGKRRKQYSDFSGVTEDRKKDCILILEDNNEWTEYSGKNGIYDLEYNKIYELDEQVKYYYHPWNQDTAFNNSSDWFVLQNKQSHLFGVFFTESKTFTGFIYRNVDTFELNDIKLDNALICQLADDNDDWDDDTCDIYLRDGTLLFNALYDNFGICNDGNKIYYIYDANDFIEPESNYDSFDRYCFKVFDSDGNIIFEDEDYRYLKMLDENHTFSFFSMVDVDADGKYTSGVIDYNGNVIIKPEYAIDSNCEFNYIGNGCYSYNPEEYTYQAYAYKGNKYAFDFNGNAVISGKDIVNISTNNCGAITYSDNNGYNCNYYVCWLLDYMNNNNYGMNICTEDNRDVLYIGEELSVFVKDSNNALVQIDGSYSVSSSNTDVIEVTTQGTGVVCAVLKGCTIGDAIITIEFPDGKKIEKSFSVELSNRNILEYFPEAVTDNDIIQIFSDASNLCYLINESYSGWDDAVVSYFTCLKKGGTKVLSNKILSSLGLSQSLKEEYIDEAVRELMYEICSVDSSFEDTVDSYSKQWTKFKNYYKATNSNLKDYIDTVAVYSSYDSQALFEGASEIVDAYSGNIDLIDDGVDLLEVVSVVLCTESIKLDVVNQLLDILEPGSELYNGIERLKIDLTTNFAQRITTEYIQKQLIDKIAKLMDEFILSDFSKAYTSLAKICTDLIVEKYKDAGGVMANDVYKAIYTTSFTSEFEMALKGELLNYQLGKVDDYDKFRFIYECYASSVCVALESCASICKSEYSYMKNDAERYKRLIRGNCGYNDFMRISKQAALNNYPQEFVIEDNGSGHLIVRGYNKKIIESATPLRLMGASIRNNIEKENILYLPSSISGVEVESIGEEAFMGDSEIKAVIIADGIKSIGANAFKDCINLEYVFMSDVEEIGSGAFSGCASLKLTSLSDGITEINESVFKDCEALEAITIPESVDNIFDSAFSGCTSLKSVTFLGSDTNISENAIETENLDSVYGYNFSFAESFAESINKDFYELYNKVKSLSIVNEPSQKVFNCGSAISTEGLTLKAVMADGSEIIVDNGFSISYSDMPGTQLVSVHYLNATAAYEIELKEIPVQDIIVNNDSLTLFIGDRKRIVYTTLPSNSVAHNVKVISDDEDIIKIVNNEMIAVSPGNTDIYLITSDSITSARYNFTVTSEKTVNWDSKTIFKAPISGYYYIENYHSTITVNNEKSETIACNPQKVYVYLEENEEVLISLSFDYYYMNEKLRIKYMDKMPVGIEIVELPEVLYEEVGLTDLSKLQIAFHFADDETEVWSKLNGNDFYGRQVVVRETKEKIFVFWEGLQTSIEKKQKYFNNNTKILKIEGMYYITVTTNNDVSDMNIFVAAYDTRGKMIELQKLNNSDKQAIFNVTNQIHHFKTFIWSSSMVPLSECSVTTVSN